MLTLWREEARLANPKQFLSCVLEELLGAFAYRYGCVLIRPLAQIGPEAMVARADPGAGENTITVTDLLERGERTRWRQLLSPGLKEFVLKQNDLVEGAVSLREASLVSGVEPEGPARDLSVVSVGLAQGDHGIGSLHLIAEGPAALREEERSLLLNVAHQVSVLLENRSLQQSTRVDPLTRLFNRGYMIDRLKEEITRTSRTGRPFTFLMLDVDHFKSINDTYGHPAGDEILYSLAAYLKRSCRASDAICRYGGEEIGMILADTAAEGAKVFAENIRQGIAALPFAAPDRDPIRITASLGFAQYDGARDLNPEEIIKRADEALYVAKNEGRNRWRAFES